MDNRLNNFILWTKGWYKPIDEDMDLFDQARQALYLDGYICCKTNKDVISVILTFIDDLIENDLIKPIRMRVFYDELNKNKYLFKQSDEYALLFALINLFGFDISLKKLKLNPPIYNRKVYKLGFIGPSHMGNSYKMLNYKARSFFKNRE